MEFSLRIYEMDRRRRCIRPLAILLDRIGWSHKACGQHHTVQNNQQYPQNKTFVRSDFHESLRSNPRIGPKQQYVRNKISANQKNRRKQHSTDHHI